MEPQRSVLGVLAGDFLIKAPLTVMACARAASVPAPVTFVGQPLLTFPGNGGAA